jgi:hypothetical protein
MIPMNWQFESAISHHFEISFFMTETKKSKVEWVIIIGLATLFGAIWLLAHWNLSRQPPHHKGPGSVGYEDPNPIPVKLETNSSQ